MAKMDFTNSQEPVKTVRRGRAEMGQGGWTLRTAKEIDPQRGLQM